MGSGSVGSNSVLRSSAMVKALMDNSPVEQVQFMAMFNINLEELHMIETPFAQGASGTLFKGAYHGEEVAVKLMESHERTEKKFYDEVKTLVSMQHDNVVRFIGCCRKPMVCCIVTEYVEGGSVRMFLEKRGNRSVPLKLAVKLALDVARGMAYVHGEGIIHRDLKSDNLLISKDKSIKIADFGTARLEDPSKAMTPETGSYRWMAPEMLLHEPYTHKVDVYSFGIVLWELITGMLPFADMAPLQAAIAVVKKNARPSVPNVSLPVLNEIMTRCWDVNPEVRPPFSEVVQMLEHAETELMTTVRRALFRGEK